MQFFENQYNFNNSINFTKLFINARYTFLVNNNIIC